MVLPLLLEPVANGYVHDPAPRPPPVRRRPRRSSSAHNVIDLVRALSRGPCSCIRTMDSCGWSTDPVTGVQDFHYELGPKQECLRCAARRCLQADNIEYEKVDHVPAVVTT